MDRQLASNSFQLFSSIRVLQLAKTHWLTCQIQSNVGVSGKTISEAFFCTLSLSITISFGQIPSSWKHWKAQVKSSCFSPGRKQKPIEKVIPELEIPI